MGYYVCKIYVYLYSALAMTAYICPRSDFWGKHNYDNSVVLNDYYDNLFQEAVSSRSLLNDLCYDSECRQRNRIFICAQVFIDTSQITWYVRQRTCYEFYSRYWRYQYSPTEMKTATESLHFKIISYAEVLVSQSKYIAYACRRVTKRIKVKQ